MRNFPFYEQYDKMDCGPTCLRMIAKFYGKDFSLEQLRKYTQISREGVSILGISEAADKIGFKSVATKITYNQLINDVPKPAIIHWGQNHFVVVTPKTKIGKIIIADPSKGILTLQKQDFLANWITYSDGDTGLGIVLVLEPTTTFFENQNESDNSAFRGLGWNKILSYFFAHKKNIVQLILSLFLGSLFQLLFPFLTQSIIDTGINARNLSFIQLILIAQFILFFSQTIIVFIRSRILLFISTQINFSLLSDFWIKLTKLPISYFDTKSSGDIIQRLGDHNRIESFLTGSALNTLFSLFNLVIFSIVLYNYNSFVFFLFLTGSILYLLWIRIFLKFRRELDYKRFEIAASENTATMQLIHGMQELKLNNAENIKRWEWENIQAKIFKLNFKSLSLSQYQYAGAFFINESKNILITFFIAKNVIAGNLTLGAMFAILYIIGQLNSPIEQLITFIQSAQDAKISLERLNEIHSLEDEESSNENLQNFSPINKTISLNNVSFAYPGAGNGKVLKDISLTVPEGKITAIVGMSGSGKTTLLKLLLRFYNDYSGDIKIGETHLNRISPKFWRTQCGSVMQDGFIFSDTIANNIAISDTNPNYEKLVYACKVANILSFIENLPLGFNTKIGADGNGISQGQKQRLFIARAVYKDPEYIFFDEATNALDANNEKVILENLLTFFRGKTVIVVAHRLSTVKNADNIVVLYNGEIIEQGKHEELVEIKGKYFELVKNQLELGN